VSAIEIILTVGSASAFCQRLPSPLVAVDLVRCTRNSDWGDYPIGEKPGRDKKLRSMSKTEIFMVAENDPMTRFSCSGLSPERE
jgi:hypothetical protein